MLLQDGGAAVENSGNTPEEETLRTFLNDPSAAELFSMLRAAMPRQAEAGEAREETKGERPEEQLVRALRPFLTDTQNEGLDRALRALQLARAVTALVCRAGERQARENV